MQTAISGCKRTNTTRSRRSLIDAFACSQALLSLEETQYAKLSYQRKRILLFDETRDEKISHNFYCLFIMVPVCSVEQKISRSRNLMFLWCSFFSLEMFRVGSLASWNRHNFISEKNSVKNLQALSLMHITLDGADEATRAHFYHLAIWKKIFSM